MITSKILEVIWAFEECYYGDNPKIQRYAQARNKLMNIIETVFHQACEVDDFEDFIKDSPYYDALIVMRYYGLAVDETLQVLYYNNSVTLDYWIHNVLNETKNL